MSKTITLYTPGTGLPDFEMRIALGLCTVALNAVEPEKITLRSEHDRYAIDVDDSQAHIRMKDSLSWFCANNIGDSTKLTNISGFYGAIVNPSLFKKSGKERFPGYAKLLARFALDIRNSEPRRLFATTPTERKKLKKAFLSCGHTSNSKITMTAITPLSPEIGKVPLPSKGMFPRMAVKRDNLDVCPLCATLGILGASSFQIHLIVPAKKKGKQIYSFLPRFVGKVPGSALSVFWASLKHVKQWQEKRVEVPMSAICLVLLASYPHLVDALSLYNIRLPGFFVSVAEQEDKAPRYVGRFEQNTEIDLKYLQFSPYNRALVLRIYDEKRFDNCRSKLLGFLARSFQNYDEKSTLDFARTYVSATEGKSLLPLNTTKFFAKEVSKMDKTLLEGEKFKVVKEVADMLQHFVRDRNFGYVDNLRKARDADEFARLLLDAQREAQSVVLDPKKQDKKPFLPGQNTIQRLLQLVNETREQFQAIQTLIALLAFTYYRREE